MATIKDSTNERIRKLKEKVRHDSDETIRELDKLLELEQASGGSRPPGGDDDGSGGGPGSGGNGP